MTWQGRAALLAMIVWVNVAMRVDMSPLMGFGVMAGVLIVVWRSVPGILKRILGFGIGGAIAGLLILGPGLRVAMRVVAIVDPDRSTEFSLEGTLFVVLGIGLMLGTIGAVIGGFYRLILGVRSSVLAGVIVAADFMIGLIFFSGDISNEVFSLGAGAWMNIPLFGVFALAYGIAAMTIADRFTSHVINPQSMDREKVPA